MKGSSGQDDGTTRKHTEAAEAVGAASEAVGAAAEGVGEAAKSVGAEEGVSGAGKSGRKGREDPEIVARYPSRDRKTPAKFWISETSWVSPKAKKRAEQSG